MAGIVLAALAGLGLVVVAMAGARRPSGVRYSSSELEELIRSYARAGGLPPDIAVAWARVETGIVNKTGDRQLHKRKGYMAKVAQEHPNHPDLRSPELWASYGPFQLQARYHIRGLESPTVLLDPHVSIPRAVTTIRRLLDRAGGDVLQARVWYVCGRGGCATGQKEQAIRERFVRVNPGLPLRYEVA